MSAKRILPVLFISLLASIAGFAQNPVNIRVDTKLKNAGNGQNLLEFDVSTWHTQSGGPNTIAWSSADFVLNVDTNALDLTKIRYAKGDQGIWSSTKDTVNFEYVHVSRGADSNTIVCSIRRKIGNPFDPNYFLNDTKLPFVPDKSLSRVIRFTVPIKKGCPATASISWRSDKTTTPALVVRGKGARLFAFDGVEYNLADFPGYPIIWAAPPPVLRPIPGVPTLASEPGRPDRVGVTWPSAANAFTYKIYVYDATGTVLQSDTEIVAPEDNSALIFRIPALKTDPQDGCHIIRVRSYTNCDSSAISEISVCPTQCRPHLLDASLVLAGANSDGTFCVPANVCIKINKPDSTYIEGDSVYISFNNGASYAYRDSVKCFNNIGNSAATDTVIIIKAWDQFKCVANSDTIKIRFRKLQNPATVLQIAPLNQFYCAGEKAKLVVERQTGWDPIEFTWSTTGTGRFVNASGDTVSPALRSQNDTIYYQTNASDATGNGTVNFTVRNECFHLVSNINTIVTPQPSAAFAVRNPRYPSDPTNPVAGEGATFVATRFSANPSATYYWDFGNGSTAITKDSAYATAYSEPKTYTVKLRVVADNGGCTDELTKQIEINSFKSVFVPNAFAPEANTKADNKNVRVYGKGVKESEFTFIIFSRWGETVYEANNFHTANTIGWNGKKNNDGEDMPIGTYTYAVKGKYSDNTSFQKTGNVTLIK